MYVPPAKHDTPAVVRGQLQYADRGAWGYEWVQVGVEGGFRLCAASPRPTWIAKTPPSSLLAPPLPMACAPTANTTVMPYTRNIDASRVHALLSMVVVVGSVVNMRGENGKCNWVPLAC